MPLLRPERRLFTRLKDIREKGLLGALLDGDMAEQRQRMILDGIVFGVTNRLSTAVQQRTIAAMDKMREGGRRFLKPPEKIAERVEAIKHKLEGVQ